jgi:hypothetical protein
MPTVLPNLKLPVRRLPFVQRIAVTGTVVLVEVLSALSAFGLQPVEEADREDRGATTRPHRHFVDRRISAEDREAIGLVEPTWTSVQGKVHPDVLNEMALEQEDAKNPLKTLLARPRHPVWQAGFRGYVYVVIYLAPTPDRAIKENADTAINEMERRILARWRANDFCAVYQFVNRPALVGFINAAGLARATSDPDVTAIACDEKNLIKEPPHALPESRRSSEYVGKVEAEIYELLEKSTDGYVHVIVSLNSKMALKQPADPCAPVDIEARQRDYIEGMKPVEDSENRILSELTAEEFKLRTRDGILSGFVNAVGLKKLAVSPEVRSVWLSRYFKMQDSVQFRRSGP